MTSALFTTVSVRSDGGLPAFAGAFALLTAPAAAALSGRTRAASASGPRQPAREPSAPEPSVTEPSAAAPGSRT